MTRLETRLPSRTLINIRLITAHFTHRIRFVVVVHMSRVYDVDACCLFISCNPPPDAINRKVLFHSFSNAKRHVVAFDFVSDFFFDETQYFYGWSFGLFAVWLYLNNCNGIVMNTKQLVYKSIHKSRSSTPSQTLLHFTLFLVFFGSQSLRRESRATAAVCRI